MVNFQDSTAFARPFIGFLIVFLLSAGISFGQGHGNDSDVSQDEHATTHDEDHGDAAQTGEHQDAGHENDEHDADMNSHDGGHGDDAHHADAHGSDDHHAEGHGDGHHEEEEGVGEMILGHIKDDHVWHFWNEGVVYLPVILYTEDGVKTYNSADFYEHHAPVPHDGYMMEEGKVVALEGSPAVIVDFSITKNVASLLISLVVMLFIFLSVGRNYKGGNINAPKGLARLFEPIVVFIRDDVAKPNIGPKYEKFMPYLLTLFFFIWLNNLFGLTPGAANLTGNIAVTFTLAILTFIIVNVNGNKNYWRHILAMPGVPKPVLLILTPVEILSIFTKPFSLMIRLFVAITAGHIVVLSLIGLIFIFKSWAIAPASMLLVTFVNMIELLVATIQAYVFTMFTALYIGQAVEEHHDH